VHHRTGCWAWVAFLATCCIPSCCIRVCFGKSNSMMRQAWREKVRTWSSINEREEDIFKLRSCTLFAFFFSLDRVSFFRPFHSVVCRIHTLSSDFLIFLYLTIQCTHSYDWSF
jgi:hypothetical protein